MMAKQTVGVAAIISSAHRIIDRIIGARFCARNPRQK